MNKYGEEVKVGRVVGLEAQRGRMRGHWLVSRRIAWAPVIGESQHAAQVGNEGDAAGQAQGDGTATARAALAAPWTGFNNCTARTTGGLTRQFYGRGRHHIEDCYPTDVVAQFKKLQQQKAWQ